ncbi:MAG: hypothetical protein EPO28_03215 [Saprospiraceae bacterium]|nr:MAG: hypothetical protein EPO28_03215 [Saprospiraceae bacterium]
MPPGVAGPVCNRLEFKPYILYTGSQTPPPATFPAHYFRLEIEINGKGYFDGAMSSILTPITGVNGANGATTPLIFTSDKKKVILVSQCIGNQNDIYSIPYGSPASPFLSLVVVAEPGEVVTLMPSLVQTMYNPDWIGGCTAPACDISSASSSNYLPVPASCSSDLSVTLTGIPPSGIVDPHTDVPIYLELHNNGSSPVTISELDFRISLTDAYNTLPDFVLEPAVYPVTDPPTPPAFEYHEGDDHYYLLNSINANNTIPANGKVVLLAGTILPPEGLANLLGEAKIVLKSMRINLGAGGCCKVDESPVNTMVTFPGELNCDQSFFPKVSFDVIPIDPNNLEDCEVGFAIRANVLTNTQGQPATITLNDFLLEFKTLSSANLQISEVIGLPGISTSFTNAFIPCPPGISSPTGCSSGTATLSFQPSPGNPDITIHHGDSYGVILSGLNGTLHQITPNRAKIKEINSMEACIPPINTAMAPTLPITSSCNYCDNITIHAEPYVGELGDCEAGFSIHLTANTLTPIQEISVQFNMLTTGTLANIVATPLNFCTNANNNCSSGQAQCVVVNGNTVTAHFCLNGNGIDGNNPLLNVKFNNGGAGMACVTGIIFTAETSIKIPLIGDCVPKVVLSNVNPFNACSSCFSSNHAIGGTITTALGIPVQVDNLPANGEGIFIRDVSETNPENPCAALPVNCSFVTSTAPCGEYNHDFTCASNFFVVQPKRDDNPVNGVTTFDLVLITRHITGAEYLDSWYKMVAADANHNNVITTFDVVVLRKLILFIAPTFAEAVGNPSSAATSWRFVDANYVFPPFPYNNNAANLPAYPQCKLVDLSASTGDPMVGFIAVKIGDVNNSVAVTGNCAGLTGGGSEERGDDRPVDMLAGFDRHLKAGETTTLSFSIKSLNGLVAWESGLRFDPRYLQLEEALPGDLYGMTPGNLGLTEAADGKVRVLWYAPDAQPAWFGEAQYAFSLRFKALRPIDNWSSVLTIDNSILQGRAYEDDGTEHAIRLDFTNEVGAAPGRVEDKQMQVTAVPNPFRDELRFYISVPEDDWVEVSVFDVNGRLVASWSGEIAAREKEVSFDSTKDWGDGVFTYRVRTARQSVTGKITRQ